MSRFGGDEIIIKQMIIQQTGGFQDVYNRPYEMDSSSQNYEVISERIRSLGGNRINDKTFRGVNAGILGPSSTVDQKRDRVHIPEGWDRPRCRFSMEVVVKRRSGNADHYYFQGYTNHMGLGASSVDEDMVFYMNGFIRVATLTRATVRGNESYGVVTQSAQIVNGEFLYKHDEGVHFMRPSDMFSGMQQRFMESGYSGTLTDTRTRLGSPSDSLVTKRDNNLAGNYLTSVLGAYQTNQSAVDFGCGQEDILARAQSSLTADDLMLSDNPFLRRLSQVRGVSSSTTFTIRDLINVDPECRNGIVGARLSSSAMGQLAVSGDSASWRDGTTHAKWATQISNGLGSIMMSNYHTELAFSVTNENSLGRIIIMVQSARAVADNLPTEVLDRMTQAVEDLFFDLSGGGLDVFNCHIEASLYDQTRIDISVHNVHFETFFVPSFADSLMSPFYTTDVDKFTALSSDIEGIFSEMSGEFSGSATHVDRSM